MRDLHRSWGERLRQRRKALGLTQERLAELAGVSQPTISDLESGTRAPTDSQKWALAGALRERMDALFPYPGIVPPFPDPTKKAAA